MKQFVFLLSFLLSWTFEVSAQSNYVVNTPNSFTPGNNNTLVGASAGYSITTGSDNSFIGAGTGVFTTTGSNNSFLGIGAGNQNTIGGANSFIGTAAGQHNTQGGGNSFVGYMAGFYSDTGFFNSFLGASSGQNTYSGSYNTFAGNFSGNNNTTGSSNIFIGYSSGSNNQIGNNNVMVGDFAGLNNKVSENVFIGSRAGNNNSTGRFNTYLGFQSGYFAAADSNTFVGYQSGFSATTGVSNTFFGVNAGRNISTGSHNTIIGNGAGSTSINADDNVYIGYNTGQHDKGSGNTFIGTQAGVLLADESEPLMNVTAIGAGATVAVSNAVVLGNQANVGIGTSAPTAMLHINGRKANESGVRMEQLTSNSPVTCSTDQFLTVNEKGDVVKARYQLRITNANEWSDKVFSPSYQLRPLASIATYIGQHGHLPGVPSAEEVVNQGVDLAKMNVTLLEKIEELTLYSIQLKKADQAKQRQLDQQQTRLDQLERLMKQLLKKK